ALRAAARAGIQRGGEHLLRRERDDPRDRERDEQLDEREAADTMAARAARVRTALVKMRNTHATGGPPRPFHRPPPRPPAPRTGRSNAVSSEYSPRGPSTSTAACTSAGAPSTRPSSARQR